MVCVARGEFHYCAWRTALWASGLCSPFVRSPEITFSSFGTGTTVAIAGCGRFAARLATASSSPAGEVPVVTGAFVQPLGPLRCAWHGKARFPCRVRPGHCVDGQSALYSGYHVADDQGLEKASSGSTLSAPTEPGLSCEPSSGTARTFGGEHSLGEEAEALGVYGNASSRETESGSHYAEAASHLRRSSSHETQFDKARICVPGVPCNNNNQSTRR